jgi:GTP-dependent dephospho-CoA kinase
VIQTGGTSNTDLLKRPFGTLVVEKEITKQKMVTMLEGVGKIITVGDATTDRVLSFGITPDIAVIDGVERRAFRDHCTNYQAQEMFCTNPAGIISDKAIEVLQIALEATSPIRVKVQGEEDLLALPLFAMAPKGSAVLYGQPLEGIVLVNITEEKQNQAKDLMNKIFGNLI